MKLPEGITDIKELAYITSRKLENDEGEEEFGYKLTCPFCATEQQSRVIFKKRPYRVRCNNCNKSITIEKLSKK
jgi:transcription elongation factor Elf1